jgi:hypothetical protein
MVRNLCADRTKKITMNKREIKWTSVLMNRFSILACRKSIIILKIKVSSPKIIKKRMDLLKNSIKALFFRTNLSLFIFKLNPEKAYINISMKNIF